MGINPHLRKLTGEGVSSLAFGKNCCDRALACVKFLKFLLCDPKTYPTGLEQARRPEGALEGVPVIAALLFGRALRSAAMPDLFGLQGL
jgi:hypothetical protein